VFKIGTIVSYQGRLHVVVGVTPMSVTPQLVEIEGRQSGRIRRVPAGDLQLSRNLKRTFEKTTAKATSKHAALISSLRSSATTGSATPRAHREAPRCGSA
jgi:hypothetical protein